MKPSISMLAWYMREDEPVCSIKNDDPVISGVRFLTDETVRLSPDYVYVGAASAFFSDEKYAGGYIVVHGQDFLLFNGQELDALLNRLFSALDFFENWENRLLTAAESGAPLRTFIRLGEDVLGDFFVVSDMETNLLAASAVDPRDVEGTTWEYFFRHGRVSPESLNAPPAEERRSPEITPYPQLMRSSDPAVPDLIVQFLFQDDEPVAYLAVNQTSRSFTRMQLHVVPVLCRYLIRAAEFTARQSAVQSVSRQLARMLEGEPLDENQLSRFRRRLPKGAFRVLCFHNTVREDTIHVHVLLSALRAGKVLCASSGGAAVALIPDELWRSTAESLLRSAGLTGLRCGVSAPTRDLSTLTLRLKQARFALEQAPKKEGVYCCEDYALSYLLYLLRSDASSAFLVHPAVEKLAEYDGENQTELLPTLNEFLRQDRNLQKTLEALSIHRSTLKYRLQRIADLTGADLEDPGEEAYLRLSLWLKFPPEERHGGRGRDGQG